jgi:hypothetical protein
VNLKSTKPCFAVKNEEEHDGVRDEVCENTNKNNSINNVNER